MTEQELLSELRQVALYNRITLRITFSSNSLSVDVSLKPSTFARVRIKDGSDHVHTSGVSLAEAAANALVSFHKEFEPKP